MLEEVRKPNMDMNIPGDYRLSIRTLEGVMDARKGDYIIRGGMGNVILASPISLKKRMKKQSDGISI